MTGTEASETTRLRATIRAHYRCDPGALLQRLSTTTDVNSAERHLTDRYSDELLTDIRNRQEPDPIRFLLNVYPLSGTQGRRLMELSEALQRVPDAGTALALVRDKLQHPESAQTRDLPARLVATLLAVAARCSEMPVLDHLLLLFTKPAVRLLGSQFVYADNINAALRHARHAGALTRFSFDMLGEGARGNVTAEKYWSRYRAALAALPEHATSEIGISVKLSALHPRFHFHQRHRLRRELLPRLRALALAAKTRGVALTIDAEEADRLESTLDMFQALRQDPALCGWNQLGLAVQAYQKRATFVLQWLAEVARQTQASIPVRLVKGAYWDSEIKWSQQGGYNDFPVFTEKNATDQHYLLCARYLLQQRPLLVPQFATHNAFSVAAILAMDELMPDSRQGYEFQRLHGMGAALHASIMQSFRVPSRIYAPVGNFSDLLPYLVRRLLENGANNSFVNQLERDAGASAAAINCARIRLPAAIYQGRSKLSPPRRNSSTLDLYDSATLASFDDALKISQPRYYGKSADSRPVLNPADTKQCLGSYDVDDAASMLEKLRLAEAALMHWSTTGVAQRAQLSRSLASALEDHARELTQLLVREAGKTLPDAVAEVREAADFCRYYAAWAEQICTPASRPLGVVWCISPWNFPLAIFLGQSIAALVCGNTVVAKPAEQTSLIALRVQELLYGCGFPANVLQLILSEGPAAGRSLVTQEAIKGICFTGSLATAEWLAQHTGQRPQPVTFIAETGGQNAMLVDATALPEQVVDDIIQSAFLSAGQRCSALRVLFVQQEVADRLLAMLVEAMDSLTVGDPQEVSTDIGPLIDAHARQRLQQHLEYLDCSTWARLVHRFELDESHQQGHFFGPRLYEIDHIGRLQQEVFGPVLHVIRFAGGDIEQVITQINSTGFGLTCGIHSRIQRRCRYFAGAIRAGNIYINRNMIGAVVGVQPFGGRGLSGTGPKAGGPEYLRSLTCADKTEPSPAWLPDEQLLHADPGAAKGSIPDSLLHHVQSFYRRSPERRYDHLVQLGSRLQACIDKPERRESSQLLQQSLQFAETLLWQIHRLDGPVGESNEYLFEPRGVVVVLSENTDSSARILQLLCLCLLTGNAPILLYEQACQSAAESVQQCLLQGGIDSAFSLQHHSCLASLMQDSHIAAVITQSESRQQQLKRLAAELGEPHKPILYEANQTQLMRRLMLEKSISTNTAASGGVGELLFDQNQFNCHSAALS